MKSVIAPGEVKRIIASSNTYELKRNLKLKDDQDVFKILLDYLEVIVSKFDDKYISVSYKILGFLEQLSVEEKNNLMDKSSAITNLKDEVIKLIKEKKDDNKSCDREIVFLKDFANRLENLEINIIYNFKDSFILANYNIVKQILFKEKDLNFSIDLIEKNAHLVNAYNLNDNNIFEEVVNNYLSAIDDYAKRDNNYDLHYYDEILKKLLESNKIHKDSEILEKCIYKVSNYDKSIDKTGRECSKASYWYKHLEKALDSFSFDEDIDSLNKLYGISFYYKNDVIADGYKKGFVLDSKTMNCAVPMDYIVTIDDKDTIDRDDAFSVSKRKDGTYELKIFIADPNSFYGDLLSYKGEVRKRVETLYLSDRRVYMFPDEIITGYLSLDQDKYRLVREYKYLISPDGEVLDFNIDKKTIKVSKNFSYNGFNRLIKKSNSLENEKLIEDLISLRSILTDKGCNDITSEDIIETLMIFNNNKLAKYFTENDLPFVYRYHIIKRDLDYDSYNLQDVPLKNRNKYVSMLKNIEKINLPAFYSVENKSHESLDLPYYCHSTSPLRRYADILVNECEDKFYFNNMSDKDREDFLLYLKNEVYHINDRAFGIAKYYDEYEKARIRMLK